MVHSISQTMNLLRRASTLFLLMSTLSSASQFVYVSIADEMGGCVKLVDIETRKIVAESEKFNVPTDIFGDKRGMAIAGESLFVVNPDSGDLTVLDKNTLEIIHKSIPVGKHPSAITANNEVVFVANRGSQDISVINAKTYEVIHKSIPVEGDPVAITMNRTLVFVAHYDGREISVINAKTYKIETPIQFEYGTSCIDANDKFLVLISSNGKKVSLYDAETLKNINFTHVLHPLNKAVIIGESVAVSIQAGGVTFLQIPTLYTGTLYPMSEGYLATNGKFVFATLKGKALTMIDPEAQNYIGYPIEVSGPGEDITFIAAFNPSKFKKDTLSVSEMTKAEGIHFHFAGTQEIKDFESWEKAMDTAVQKDNLDEVKNLLNVNIFNWANEKWVSHAKKTLKRLATLSKAEGKTDIMDTLKNAYDKGPEGFKRDPG